MSSVPCGLAFPCLVSPSSPDALLEVPYESADLVCASNCSADPYHFGPWDFWRMTPDSLKQLVSPFSRVIMCGSHRSSSLAALLAQPDAKKAIKIYPASDTRGTRSTLGTHATSSFLILSCFNLVNAFRTAARRMVLEPSRAKSTSRPRWGWAGDRNAPSGEPKYGEAVTSSWILAAR